MRILEIARKYLGQSELPGNKFTDLTPLGKLVHSAGQKDGEAWCAYFVEGCSIEAFPEMKHQLEKLFSANCVETFHNFKKAGFKVLSIDPLPGDICVMRSYRKGVAQLTGHMCIVEAIDVGNGFQTIDGNTNIAGSREGTTVMDRKQKSFKFNPDGLTVLGFIRL